MNGSHLALGWVGLKLGCKYGHEVFQNPEASQFLYELMRQELVPTIPMVPEIDSYKYCDELFIRYQNPKVFDPISRLTTDGFAKIRSRILPSIQNGIEREVSTHRLSTLLAIWESSDPEAKQNEKIVLLGDGKRHGGSMALNENELVYLFDYDDTLATSEKPAHTILEDVIREITGKSVNLKQFLGKSVAFEQILDQLGFGVDPQVKEKILKTEKLEMPKRLPVLVKETTGSFEILNALNARGVIWAIVTSSSVERVNACMTKLGQSDLLPLHRVFSARSHLVIPRVKPDPAIYQFAMSTLGKRTYIAIEDSVPGITAAKTAGVQNLVGFTGACSEGKSQRRVELLRAGAQIVIDDLNQLSDYVTRRKVGKCG